MTVSIPVPVFNNVRWLFKHVYDEGALDYSRREQCFYLFLSGSYVFFAKESSALYLTLGGRGARYLPGSFGEDWIQQASFWCNALLNWYFMMDTTLTIRNAFYEYQLAKKMNVDILWRRESLKCFIALGLAVTTGIVFALVDSETTSSVWNQSVTGAVNVLLNFLGAIALEEFIIKAFFYVKRLFFRAHHVPNIQTWESEKTEQTMLTCLDNHLGILSTYAAAKNELNERESANSYSYLCFILQNHSTVKLNKTSMKKFSFVLKVIFYTVFHVFMQIFDKIALYGYLRDTIALSGTVLGIDIVLGKNLVGLILFAPFAALSASVVYSTTKSMLCLLETGTSRIANLLKHPRVTKSSVLNFSLLSVSVGLSMFAYFIAYLSAGSALALNAEYGLNSSWSVYPVCIASSAFNGFGFLNIISLLTTTLMGYMFCSQAQRTVVRRMGQIHHFFHRYPQAVTSNSASTSTAFYYTMA